MILTEQDIAGYDIIGDVHGCDRPLVALLEKMGYRLQGSVYQHPGRKVIFVGDIIDRGPGIRRCLHIVRAMVEAGSAHLVMGNHEYNALYARETLAIALREGIQSPAVAAHGRLLKLMKATIEQFTGHTKEWNGFLDWFARLPLFIETPGFRVVHACWDQELIDTYKVLRGGEPLGPDFIAAARHRDSIESQIIDRLTRGTTLALPEGMTVESNDGFIRRIFRAKFWAIDPLTYADVVFQPDPLPYEIQHKPIKHDERQRLVHYSPDAVPVFFGHYWMKGRPEPLQGNIACLDYSAVNYGRLVAYRFSGETTLNRDNFSWIYVDP